MGPYCDSAVRSSVCQLPGSWSMNHDRQLKFSHMMYFCCHYNDKSCYSFEHRLRKELP